MQLQSSPEITGILQDWNSGDESARERLIPYVYAELKRQARLMMRRERGDHTLQPTALVHEAYMRIAEDSGIEWLNRNHFFGIAARVMRQVLIQHARRVATTKRGGQVVHFSLDETDIPLAERAGALLALDDALERLEQLNERQAQIVDMRFFAGLTNAEIADVLKISERTVLRNWEAARVWLFHELKHNY